MMSDRRPNNRGVLVGRVVKLDKAANKATLKLDKELHLDDGLEFWVSRQPRHHAGCARAGDGGAA